MTPKGYSEITRCRICGGSHISDIIDFGDQAIGSQFPFSDEPDPPKAPLVLVGCSDCGLVQLRHSVNPGELYTYAYGYQSGINGSMRGHLDGLVRWVEARCALAENDIVLDIGCNDGTLLESYVNPGLRRFGIDAIAGKFKHRYGPNIIVREGFFSADEYKNLCGEEKAKIITSISMFYDLESPGAFVAAIRAALAPDGIWVLEQSYLPSMLATNAYDTVCHEHLEYYSLRQIEWLAKAHGLRVFDVELNSANGGSFRVAVCHENGPYAADGGQVAGIRKQEAAMGLDTPAPYEAFKKRVDALRQELVDFIDRERAIGKTFYLYGASTKGNTLLQYCCIDGSKIVAAAERNSEKWGCRTPATGIPIISEEEARNAKPDYFLVMPWHFKDEFVQREAPFREMGGRLVFPLPVLEVV